MLSIEAALLEINIFSLKDASLQQNNPLFKIVANYFPNIQQKY